MRKGFAPIAALVIIATIFIGTLAGILFLKSRITNLNKQVLSTASPSSTIIPAPSSLPTVDVTANWKTYQGNGFHLKYPNTYLASSSDDYIKEFQFNSKKPIQWGECLAPQQGEGEIYINVDNFAENPTTLENYANFERKYLLNRDGGIELDSTTIDGQKANLFRYSKQGSQVVPCGLKEDEAVDRLKLVSKNGRPYSIDLRYFENSPALKKQLDQILSTFKFIN